jgi:DNA-binding phage protein
MSEKLAVLVAGLPPERRAALFDEVLTMPRKTRTPEPIAGTIKATIKARGMTAYSVGKASGVSSTIISRWLNGHRSPSLGTIEKIVTALDLVLMDANVVILVEAKTSSKSENKNDSRS